MINVDKVPLFSCCEPPVISLVKHRLSHSQEQLKSLEGGREDSCTTQKLN